MSLINNINSLAARVGAEFNVVRGEAAAIADARYTKAETEALLSTSLSSLAKVDAGAISSTDVGVYADSSRTPQPDPRGFGGWYFKNIAAGQKINWYPYNGGSAINGAPSYGELSSVWAVFTFYNTTSAPFLTVYSKRTGTGDAASWYKSRWVFDAYTGAIPAGTTSANPSRVLVFWGTDPGVHPELPRIEIRKTLAFNSNGTRSPSEEILTYAWGTNSAAAVNLNDFTVEQVGHAMRNQLVSHSLVHVGASLADVALKANSSDIGATNTNYVSAFEAALV